MDYKEWIAAGKLCGLEGSELMEFAERKQREVEAREDRARQHEEKREERLAQEKAEEAKFKAEEARLKAEEDERKTPGQQQVSTPELGKALRPKLPKFDEAKDDIDAFLERFERFAENQKWPKET